MVLAATLAELLDWLKFGTPLLSRTYRIFRDAVRALTDVLTSSTWQRVLILAPSDAACLAAGILSGAAWAAAAPAAVLSLFVVLPEGWPEISPGYVTLPTLNQGFQLSVLATKAGFIIPGGGCSNGVCLPVVEIPKSLSCGVAALLLRDELLDATAVPLTTLAAALAATPGVGLFQQWLYEADLLSTLAGQGSLTVFAPSDAALERQAAYLGLSVPEMLAGPLACLQGYYLVPGLLGACPRATASDGFELTLTRDACGTLLFVNAAPVLAEAVSADNGQLLFLDDLLMHGLSGPAPCQVTARRNGRCGA